MDEQSVNIFILLSRLNHLKQFSFLKMAGGDEPLKWQIDTGEGFLRDAPDDVMGDMMGSGMALAKAESHLFGNNASWSILFMTNVCFLDP